MMDTTVAHRVHDERGLVEITVDAEGLPPEALSELAVLLDAVDEWATTWLQDCQ